jgi:hypothetical protein
MALNSDRDFLRVQARIVSAVGIAASAFVALVITRFDALSLLGLDIFIDGGAESAKFSPNYILLKTLINLGISIAAGVFAFFYFKLVVASARIRSKSAEIALSTPKAIIRKSLPQSQEKREESLQKIGALGRLGEVIRRLNERIDALQRRASVIYWTILVSLIVGIFLIIFAGYLSSFDTTYSNLSLQLQSDRQGTLSDLARSYSRLNSPEEETSRKYLLSRLANLDQQSTELFSSMTRQLSERSENKPTWNWPSTFLRVGVIGLLVFLTQILISLYRYNSRIIAFYGSRRDALLLSNGIYDDFTKYAEMLFPLNLDFGREPRHPLEEIRSFFGRKPPSAANGERDPEAIISPKPKSKNRTRPARATASGQTATNAVNDA